jgi:hypothetical protein
MSEQDERNVVEMRCYPVNEPASERLTAHAWWWLASGIFLAIFLPVDAQVTQSVQVITGAVVILPAAMTLLRWWNAKSEGSEA